MRIKFYLTKYHKLNDLLSSKITHINVKKETITFIVFTRTKPNQFNNE